MTTGYDRFDGPAWDDVAPGTPFVAASGATTTRQVLVPPYAKVVVLAFSAPSNVTAVNVTGLGSQAQYVAAVGPLGNSFLLLHALPSIDDRLIVAVTCGAGAASLVYVDMLSDAGGLGVALPGNVGSNVSLRSDASADAKAGNAVDEIALAGWNGLTLDRLRTNAALDGAAYNSAGVPASVLYHYDPATGKVWMVAGPTEGDSANGSRELNVSPYLRNPSAAFDLQRSLGASDYALGVAKVSGAPHSLSGTLTAAQCNAGTYALPLATDAGIASRTVEIQTSLDAAITIGFVGIIGGFAAGANGMLGGTMNPGNVSLGRLVLCPDGILYNSGGWVLNTGLYAALRADYDQFGINISSAGATVGTVTVAMTERT